MSPGLERVFTPAAGGLTFMISPFSGRRPAPAARWRRRIASLLFLVFAPAPPAAARIWAVRPDHGGDAPTIQAAIDSSADGDTVNVSAGFYPERCAIVNKTLLIRGAGADLTEINGYPYGHVMTLRGLDNYTEIRDLTLADASATSMADPYGGVYGGGLMSELAAFALVRCHIVRCSAGSLGGGLYATFRSFDPDGGSRSSPGTRPSGAAPPVRDAILIEDCLFANGFAGSEGGGLVLEFTRFTITGCTFRNCFSVQGGGASIFDSIGSMSGCRFEDNEALQDGGGLKVNQRTGYGPASIVVQESNFRNNRADRYGAGLALAMGHGIRVERNLFFGQGGLASAVVGCMTLDVEYLGGCNHFWNNGRPDVADCPPLASDTAGDPLFCDESGGDFRLCAASPLLARPCGPAGAFGVGCSGGDCATPTRSITWGGLKSLFR